MLSLEQITDCIEVRLGDKTYPLKYTLQSWIDLKNYGVDEGDLNSFIDPQKLCKILHAGLPEEIKGDLSLKQLASLIPYKDIQVFMDQLQDAIRQSLQDASEEAAAEEKKND